MKFGVSRKTIYNDIKSSITDKGVLNNISNTKEVVKLLTSSRFSYSYLYNMFLENISKKIYEKGGQLKGVFIKNKDDVIKVTSENAEELFNLVINKNKEIILKIMIRNKLFEFSILW